MSVGWCKSWGWDGAAHCMPLHVLSLCILGLLWLWGLLEAAAVGLPQLLHTPA